ncbi:glycosyltransferase family 2 protein [Agrobacterium rosae]|uniref:Chondroitin polymerase n=1 Tax=Agrobacterium rosae TaxID=1972867 RepID=A0A1R3U7G5_9HYPH|nr:glycosyltransferase family 2 protein [Agrobacterium rosae]SCX34075.1 Chondroitin polymerase [Agrobacterium rosae]
MMYTYRCAVVIPAKNAISILPRVLSQVVSQKTEWPYEVIVIDSGSTDGTVEYLRKLDTIRLIEIPSGEFGHGKTRNLGVLAADAEFVAFLTHDAVPIDEYWLANLVAIATEDASIAGVFGRHIAHEHASPFIKSDLDQHFEGFRAHPKILGRNTDPNRYETDQGWRQLLHFYSDNNSLLRKSVWEKIPYPDVEFAEDQLWARAIIEAGYRKGYAENAVVYHSHDYGVREQFQRAFDESRNFKKHFGYKLTPSFLHMCEAVARLSIQAFRQKVDERYGTVGFGDRVGRALRRSALVAGHCAGANHEALPVWLSARMSLDQKLFRA